MKKNNPPDGVPVWFDGKNINEALFCEEFLQTHKILFTNGAFFTPEGRVTDELPLRGEIFEELKCCAVSNIPRPEAPRPPPRTTTGGGFPAAAGSAPGGSPVPFQKSGPPEPPAAPCRPPVHAGSAWFSPPSQRQSVALPVSRLFYHSFSKISNACSIVLSTGSRPVTGAPMRSGSRSGPWIQNRHPPR